MIDIESRKIMCGLWAYLLRHGNLFSSTDYVRHEPWKHSNANRGPDRMTELQGSDYHFVFHRLAIHDISWNGDQPFMYEWNDGTVVHVMCNGEIYNYHELVEKYRLAKKLQSRSDCEVIGHLFEIFKGDEKRVFRALDGEFAFVARFENPNGEVRVVAARDRYGVRPLYFASLDRGIIFSSMLAGIVGLTEDAMGTHFPPGHTYSEILSSPDDVPRWTTHLSPVLTPALPPDNDLLATYRTVTDALIQAIKKRLDSDRNIGFLLSGGLDSSLVVAVATKILGLQSPATFCIGFDPHAPDAKYAQLVANYLGTRHTQVIITPREAMEEIGDVVRALETYDITTIRASVPQYLLAKHISENTDIRVIMNGDGSDEVACGYIYNFFAPSPSDAHSDSLRLLSEIHCFDGLRVDRCLGAHGLEARIPFLDPVFVNAYHNIPMELRAPCKEQGRMEKQFLRDAFNTLYPGILPREVLFRKKEAFSDGVTPFQNTKSWYEHLQAKAAGEGTTEPEMYKSIFDFHFPNHRHVLPHYWMPPAEWVQSTDPSARTLTTYGN